MKVLLVFASLLAVSLAASTELKRLIDVLKALDKRASWCVDHAGEWECNGGRCGGGENPHEWDKGNYYCWKCPGTQGGLQCEIPDPCASSTCSSDEKCKPSSMKKIGYYCQKNRGSKRAELMRNLDENADQPEFRAIRELMLSTGDLDKAVLENTRRMLAEEDVY